MPEYLYMWSTVSTVVNPSCCLRFLKPPCNRNYCRNYLQCSIEHLTTSDSYPHQWNLLNWEFVILVSLRIVMRHYRNWCKNEMPLVGGECNYSGSKISVIKKIPWSSVHFCENWIVQMLRCLELLDFYLIYITFVPPA